MAVNKWKYILWGLGLGGMLIFLVFILNLCEIRGEYHSISILPLLFGLLSLMLSVSKNLSFLKVIVMICYSVKFLAIPLFVSLSGYQLFYLTANYELNFYILNAVFLQCIEIITVSIFLLLYNDISPNVFPKKQNVSFFSLSTRTNFLLILLFTISIGLLLLYPQFKNNYQLIFFTDDDYLVEWTRQQASVKTSMPIYIYYLGGWIISISKLIFPFYLIIQIYKIHIKDFFKILLSLIVIVSSCIYTSSARAATIFSAILYFVLMRKMYLKHSSLITYILLVGGVFGIGMIFLYETLQNSSNIFSSLVHKFNIYFAGSFNDAAVFLMDNSDWLDYFIGDFLRSIPLIKGFFTSMPTSTIEFNRAIAIDTDYNSQIIPAIGQGYFYFGYAGAVLVPLLMLRIVFYINSRIKVANDSFVYFSLGLAFMYIFLGIYLYDVFLSFSLVLSNAFPMLVIMYLSQNRKKNEKITSISL